MADVQLENGWVRIAHSLISAIMRARLTEREKSAVLAVIELTYGQPGSPKRAAIGASQIAEYLGIERTDGQAVIRTLVRKGIVGKQTRGRRRAVLWIVKDFDLWRCGFRIAPVRSAPDFDSGDGGESVGTSCATREGHWTLTGELDQALIPSVAACAQFAGVCEGPATLTSKNGREGPATLMVKKTVRVERPSQVEGTREGRATLTLKTETRSKPRTPLNPPTVDSAADMFPAVISPVISPVIVDDGFDTFWALWPHKVSKVQARKTWDKISPSLELQAAIMAGLRRAIQADRRFLGDCHPHASTWLNGEGWCDEHRAARGSGTMNAAQRLRAQDGV